RISWSLLGLVGEGAIDCAASEESSLILHVGVSALDPADEPRLVAPLVIDGSGDFLHQPRHRVGLGGGTRPFDLLRDIRRQEALPAEQRDLNGGDRAAFAFGWVAGAFVAVSHCSV